MAEAARVLEHRLILPEHQWQRRGSQSTATNVGMLAGRRGGKTSWASIRFLELLTQGPPGLGLITGPDLPTVKQTAIQTILYGQGPKRYGRWPACPCHDAVVCPDGHSLVVEHNKSDRFFLLPDGSRAFYRGGDNPDDLRGMALKVWWAEEFTLCKPDILPILLISTIDTHGRGIATGTPKGRNWVYLDLFAKLEEVEPGRVWRGGEWEVIKYPTTENPGLELDQIEKIAAELSGQMLQQELEAEFVDWGGAVFPASVLDACFAKKSAHWGVPQPYHPVVFGCDPAGKGKDWRVIVVVCTQCRAIVDLHRSRRGPMLPFYEAMGTLGKHWDPHEFWYDETGMGGQLAGEELEARIRTHARHAVLQPYNFTAKTKAELILYCEARLEEVVAIPGQEGWPGFKETAALRSELRAYEWDDRDLETDDVMALALACMALQPLTRGTGSPFGTGGERTTVPRKERT